MINKNGLSFLSRRFVSAFSIMLAVVILPANFAQADWDDNVEARISPVGEVCVFGEECAVGLALPNSGSGEPQEPQQVYDTFCFACHGTGANNSPIFGDAQAWQPRIAKGIETLYENALNGFNNNAMPAKGLCMSCSEDELRATVDLMVNAAQ